MAIKVSADGLSIVTTKSDGKCMATIPDVCKIPGPNGAIPIPFPNMVESKNTKMTSILTEMNGGKVACMGSYCEPSTSDEAGVLKGIVSGTTKGKATFLKWSPTVKVEGRPVCRKSDLMLMNTCNTVGLAGMNQEDVNGVGFEEIEQELEPLKIQLKDGTEPRAGVPYKVVAKNRKYEGSTDSDGMIDIEIPKGLPRVKILINNEELIDFELGNKPNGKMGDQTALSNLGYYEGRVDGIAKSKTKDAVKCFQKANNQNVDGELSSGGTASEIENQSKG